MLGACLKAGGIVAGADEQDLEYLYDLGLNLGIGFQIKDDLMDAFSDNPKLGKVKGGDIMSNKKTILYIKALELANEQQGLELKEWFSKEVANNSEKVQAVLALFRTLKVEENVEAMMNTYYHKAYQDLQKLSFNNQKMEPLQAFVGVLGRKRALMDLLKQYLRKNWRLVFIALGLATVNQVFSLLDPWITGNIVDEIIIPIQDLGREQFFKLALYWLGFSVGATMISRLAKNIQDYVNQCNYPEKPGHPFIMMGCSMH